MNRSFRFDPREGFAMRSLFGRVDPFRPVARQHTRSVSVSLCGLGLTAGLMIIWVIVQALGPGVTTVTMNYSRKFQRIMDEPIHQLSPYRVAAEAQSVSYDLPESIPDITVEISYMDVPMLVEADRVLLSGNVPPSISDAVIVSLTVNGSSTTTCEAPQLAGRRTCRMAVLAQNDMINVRVQLGEAARVLNSVSTSVAAEVSVPVPVELSITPGFVQAAREDELARTFTQTVRLIPGTRMSVEASVKLFFPAAWDTGITDADVTFNVWEPKPCDAAGTFFRRMNSTAPQPGAPTYTLDSDCTDLDDSLEVSLSMAQLVPLTQSTVRETAFSLIGSFAGTAVAVIAGVRIMANMLGSFYEKMSSKHGGGAKVVPCVVCTMRQATLSLVGTGIAVAGGIVGVVMAVLIAMAPDTVESQNSLFANVIVALLCCAVMILGWVRWSVWTLRAGAVAVLAVTTGHVAFVLLVAASGLSSTSITDTYGISMSYIIALGIEGFAGMIGATAVLLAADPFENAPLSGSDRPLFADDDGAAARTAATGGGRPGGRTNPAHGSIELTTPTEMPAPRSAAIGEA